MVFSDIINHRTWKTEICDYFRTSLADFYVSPAHRWLTYTTIFILSGLGAFGGLWIYDLNYGLDFYNDIPMASKGMYAWHTATNFAVCWLAADVLLNLAPRGWGAFNRRNVRKTWLIFLIVFPIGFISQRTLIYGMVELYDPKWILRHEIYPAERPEPFAMFLFMLPLWLAIAAIAIHIALWLQARSEELLRVRIDTILEERARPALENAETTEKKNCSEDHPLPFESDAGHLLLSQICHITAEDHYLRIHYHNNGNSRHTLIRMSLKALEAHLPRDRFIRIHRSHIVSLAWIDGVKRVGREVCLTTKQSDVDLPVSRYRLPQLLPVLERFLKKGVRKATP